MSSVGHSTTNSTGLRSRIRELEVILGRIDDHVSLDNQKQELDAGLAENPAKYIDQNRGRFGSEKSKQLIEKANRFLEKKSENFLNALFERCSKQHSVVSHDGINLLSATGLQEALKELDVPVTLEQASALVEKHDIDENGALDQQQFHQAIKWDPPALEVWAKTLPLSDLLAFCLQAEAVSDPSSDPIRQLTCISRSRIEIVVEAFAGCLLQKLLPERIKYLKERIDLQDAKAEKAATGAANKFTVYQMNAGKIPDTQKSLADRIGE
jgi:hypothetical protein